MRTMVSKLRIDDDDDNGDDSGTRLSVVSNGLDAANGKSTPKRKGSSHLIDPKELINADTSKLVTKMPKPKTKDEIERLKRSEDLKKREKEKGRIEARQRAEFERERQLVLEGKMKLRKEHLKDPVLKLHHDMLKMKKKARQAQPGPRSPRPSTAKTTKKKSSSLSSNSDKKTSIRAGAYKAGVKLKWSVAMSKVSATALLERHRTANGNMSDDVDSDLSDDGKRPKKPLVRRKKAKKSEPELENVNDVENATETVVAKLIYDEKKDEIRSAVSTAKPPNSLEESSQESSSASVLNGDQEEKVKIKRLNPIFEAFDDAEGVDDLYRIAEVCVQPSYFYDL